MVRFSNLIFEKTFDKDILETMQITFERSAGVEENVVATMKSGALRDMVQNHTLYNFFRSSPWTNQQASKNEIRAEKIKVFKNLYIIQLMKNSKHFITVDNTALKKLMA